mmetsp:Transcript_19558/g.51842  ORF Transcript_19558/g.51842 Transcript_19558/m.51842 type:complete len:348 (-) Transcript_19558:14-1057(-)
MLQRWTWLVAQFAAVCVLLPAVSAEPLCLQEGPWGVALCLAAKTGCLLRDAARFAAARALPPLPQLPAPYDFDLAALQALFPALPPEVTLLPEALAREGALALSRLAPDALQLAAGSLRRAAERRRSLFAGAFPAHAALLPAEDPAACLSVAAWLLAAAALASLACGAVQASRRRPEVLFFPDRSGEHVERIRRMIGGARNRVWLAMFTLTDDVLSNELLRAHRRGVDVRIIVDDEQCSCLGADAQRLADAGVRVVTDCDKSRMHHKFVLLDQTVLTGSFNWTRQASTLNCENLCILRDRTLVKKFAREFGRLWREFNGRGGRMTSGASACGSRRPRDKTPPARGGA